LPLIKLNLHVSFYSILFLYFLKIAAIQSTKNHIAEAELISLLRQKDADAFAYLYDHYSGALYGVIFRILNKEEVAEEVLQDVFLKIWNKFDQYDLSKGKLFTWLVNIARNQAIDKTRSKEISKAYKTRGLENVVSTIDRQDYAEQKIEDIGVEEILKVLPEDQKFVVDHLYFKGYSQSEVAEEFNIPLGTVKTRLRLAMKQLRKSLGLN